MNGMKWQGRRNEYSGASGMGKAVLQGFLPGFSNAWHYHDEAHFRAPDVFYFGLYWAGAW